MAMNTVKFKSTQENFRKEYNGLKPNTVRKFTNKSDIRKTTLDRFISGKINKLQCVIFHNESNESIQNRIIDVTKLDDYYIISWKH